MKIKINENENYCIDFPNYSFFAPTIEEVCQMVHLMCEAEDIRYPIKDGFCGRELFKQEILKACNKRLCVVQSQTKLSEDNYNEK